MVSSRGLGDVYKRQATTEIYTQRVSSAASDVYKRQVAWPLYKVVALLVGLVVFVVVGLATGSAGPAVLSGAGLAAVTWLTVGFFTSPRG